MDKQQTLKAACRTLGLTHTRETLEKILHDAEKEGWSYLDFLVFVTDSEILFKQEKAKNKRRGSHIRNILKTSTWVSARRFQKDNSNS